MTQVSAHFFGDLTANWNQMCAKCPQKSITKKKKNYGHRKASVVNSPAGNAVPFLEGEVRACLHNRHKV